MEFGFILAVVFFLAAAIIAFKLSKNILKALMLVASILSITIVVGGVFTFFDFSDLKDNFASSQKIAVIKSGDTALAAMAFGPNETSLAGNDATATYSDLLKNRQYGKMLQDNYKLLIIDLQLIDDLGEIEVTNNKLSAASSKTAIASDDETLKKSVFEAITERILESPVFMFEQYKKGNLAVYPETMVFKAIKFFPSALFKSTAKKMFEGAKLTGEIVFEKILKQK